MAIILTLLLTLFRFIGFFTEPRLSNDEVHAINGEPARVMWPLADDRPRRIVTWNIERGIRFDAVAAVLEKLDADIILLQEVDRSCARSEYRDVARDLAAVLHMNWVSGGEFQEIGEGLRGRPCVSGQAILSRQPIHDPEVIHYDDQAAAKWRLNPAQPRRGGRMALRATIDGLAVYNVHLESGGNEALRGRQISDVVRDASGRRGPILIGGDFNSEGGRGSSVFKALTTGGFTNTMDPSSAIARRPIDWIFSRRTGGRATVTGAPGASDHDPVILSVPSRSRP